MKPARFYLGVFLVTASCLMLQVIQTRLLSVVLWYYLAFLVISLAMFGITAGSLWVYLRRQRFSERTLSHDLTYFSSALAIITALCGVVQMTLAPAGAATATTMLVALELGVCLAVPFFLSGVVISLALTRSPFPIGRVYAIDLAGAAIGCIGVLIVLNFTDGPSAILWVSAINALAAISFSRSGIGGEPATAMPLAGRLMRATPIFALLVICAAANGITGKGLQPLFVKGKLELGETAPAFTEWNTFARISASKAFLGPPAMWGPSPTFRPQDWPITQRGLFIDADAATISTNWDGEAAGADFLKYDVTNIAQFLPVHIVLFSLILTTGMGSLFSDKFPLNTRSRFVLWALIAAGYLAALPVWVPDTLHTFESATLMMRALLCVTVIAPAGVLMGFGFPTGMRFINAVDRRPTPWFWGINGAAGVLASSVAVAVSIALGIYVTFLISAFCYALLIPAGLLIGFERGEVLAARPGHFVGEPT